MRFLGWSVVVAAALLAPTLQAEPLAAQAAQASEAVDRQKPGAARELPAYTTKKGYAACTSRKALIKLVTHIANEETEAHRAMVNDTSSGCFLLKPGVEVRPVGYNEYFVELRPAGMKGTIFTIREAIEPKKRST